MSLWTMSTKKGTTNVYTLFFKPLTGKRVLQNEFYTKTVEWSDHKMECSHLERSDYRTKQLQGKKVLWKGYLFCQK